MKNWFDIPLHEDIRRGRFDEAVFVADLGDVAAGTAAPDYKDPCLLFKNAYLTDGLMQHTFWGDVTGAEGIPQKVLEQMDRETVRQIGAQVVEEDKRNRDQEKVPDRALSSRGQIRETEPHRASDAPSLWRKERHGTMWRCETHSESY